MAMHLIKSISEYHKLAGLPSPEHPLISLVNYSDVNYQYDGDEISLRSPYYTIALKHGVQGKMRYGHQAYDFDEGLMSFVAPGQVISVKAHYEEGSKPYGWLLLFHPDFLLKSPLADKIKQYDYFSYRVNEALHLSEKEESAMIQLMKNIEAEYHHPIDAFSQNIILAQIEVLLNYAERFYQRQFITRKVSHHSLLSQVEKWLHDYFESDSPLRKGLPSVHDLAESLNMSPSYLSQFLKVHSGQNAQQHIQSYLIDKAKEKLAQPELSISEIAYDLGFEHSQSFSRLFKRRVEISPKEFREHLN